MFTRSKRDVMRISLALRLLIMKNIFGGTCHTLIDNKNQHEAHVEGLSDNGEDMYEDYLDLKNTEVSGDNKSTINMHNNRRSRFAEEDTILSNSEVAADGRHAVRIEEDAIDDTSKSRSRFSNRD